ncbi:MAG: metalloregulator ArsR/SmtB family transcription factor [Armatimonadota bacterium]
MDNETSFPSLDEFSRMLKVLGEPTRLRIFQFLRACCCPVAVEESGNVRPVQQGDGPATVGEVCCHLTGDQKVNPNVSFHLKELRNAGLITMERRGKNMLCGVDPRVPAQLAAFFGGTETTGGCDCSCGSNEETSLIRITTRREATTV